MASSNVVVDAGRLFSSEVDPTQVDSGSRAEALRGHDLGMIRA